MKIPKVKVTHIAKLSGGTFCGAKHIALLDTVLYDDKGKCTCKNCLGVVKRIERKDIENHK